MTTLHLGDCLEVLRAMTAASVDAVVTDPPYELGFMGKAWDASGIAFRPDTWREVLRVLKPGGHLLAFAGSRTYHRIACAIEDAGFEVRDQIMWIYGSGFPKSLDVGKAIDKARDDRRDVLRVTTFMSDAADRCGITRADVDAAMGTSDMGGWWLSRLLHRCQCPKWEQWLQLKVILSLSDEMDADVWRLNGRKGTPGNERSDREVTAPGANAIYQPIQRVINPGTPVLDAARQWTGWGTALKPAHEPIVVARKPLAGTVAANVLAHGTGAINVDGCRVGMSAEDARRIENMGGFGKNGYVRPKTDETFMQGTPDAVAATAHDLGRWPANIIHDGSDEVVALFPQEAGGGVNGSAAREYQPNGKNAVYGAGMGGGFHPGFADTGSAARFFYCAKASAEDRDEGLVGGSRPAQSNVHPTVKPTDLMRYLVRLVTPPGGTVLDPFMGSGSTGKAAAFEGFGFVGIEREAEYFEIAKARIAYAEAAPKQVELPISGNAEPTAPSAAQLGLEFAA